MSCWKDKYHSISCLYARQTLIVVDVSNCRNYQARNTNSSKIFEWLELKIFLLTDLRTEPHTTALHDTIVCKFRPMSRYVSLKPGLATWLLPEDFTSNPATGILDGVPGFLAHNVRRLKTVPLIIAWGRFQSAKREERMKNSNQINCQQSWFCSPCEMFDSLDEKQGMRVRVAYLLLSIKLDLYPWWSQPKGQALVKKL